jgi:hypothetical protein
MDDMDDLILTTGSEEPVIAFAARAPSFESNAQTTGERLK